MDTKQQVPDCISEIGLGHISKIISIQSVSNLSDDESGNQVRKSLFFFKKKSTSNI